jgi:hypothetical protein
MKVVVKESGFYGGTWYDAGPAAVEMHEKVARPFLPPYGAQLALPVAAPAAIAAMKTESKAV